MNIQSAQLAYAEFFRIFNMSYEKSFPLKSKTITYKEKSYPWITESHLNDMKERDKLCKLSKRKNGQISLH